MKNETIIWLKYANENLSSAELLLDGSLFNPCLQNVQQAVEKYLKAIIVEASLGLRKTHSIGELRNALESAEIAVDLTEDECELLDSIYLPSKYPLGGVLPDFEPDMVICTKCIAIAGRIKQSVEQHFS
jgi:HEPN domain-containing protein